MYSLIFENHLDLDSVMKNFQRCVIATHDISQYPGWLKRPIDRPEVTTKKPPKGPNRSKRLEITKIMKLMLCFYVQDVNIRFHAIKSFKYFPFYIDL